ncbi:IS200/IS605 family transposase [Solwaraspora sp. WMMD406]|uniref:IS200/IS605 family transposase n=1 Tax=Solwaraspora sp. WMMD406 TaxID=3016095 RepID=UPI002416220D|nr:IS200/IS605 family transposase [Solwaraspora sp. WMMD406]MDG4763867.1 IS200/IS605 family transposase [Solwaraspora sp. WMMD406]
MARFDSSASDTYGRPCSRAVWRARSPSLNTTRAHPNAFVFVTKFRHEVFADRHLTRMEQIMRDVCRDFEAELVEFNGGHDHVHLLVEFPPKVAVARLVNSLKGVSSRRLRQEFPDLVDHYHRANKLWSGSYFAGSVAGTPPSIVKQYIEQQNRPG